MFSNSNVLPVCIIIARSRSEISIKCLAYSIESVKSLMEIEGQMFPTSKFTKDETLLLGILLNHLITLEAFFHWLKLAVD